MSSTTEPTSSFAHNDNPFVQNDGNVPSSVTDLTTSIQRRSSTGHENLPIHIVSELSESTSITQSEMVESLHHDDQLHHIEQSSAAEEEQVEAETSTNNKEEETTTSQQEEETSTTAVGAEEANSSASGEIETAEKEESISAPVAATVDNEQVLKTVLTKHAGKNSEVAKQIEALAKTHDIKLQKVAEEAKQKLLEKRKAAEEKLETEKKTSASWNKLFGYGIVVSALGIVGVMVARKFKWFSTSSF